MTEKHVISVVLVAIRKDNNILLLKRNKEPLKGYWSLVGGKLHSDESIEECAVREVKEETGMDSEFISIKGVLHERLYDEKNLKYGLLLFFVEAKPKTFKITESHEGEVKWFSLKDLDKEKIILSDMWMIKNLMHEKAKVYKATMHEKNEELTMMRIEEYEHKHHHQA